MKYADIILPLRIPKPLTYGIPIEYQETIQPGMRVAVALGKHKKYSGIVHKIHDHRPDDYQIKPIRNIIDDQPIIPPAMMQFWEWISTYYMCTLGDVMQAALPAHLKLMNESILIWNESIEHIPEGMSDDAVVVATALRQKKKISIKEIRSILDDIHLPSVLDELLIRELAFVSEDLEEKYAPKVEELVVRADAFQDDDHLRSAMDALSNAPKQLAIIMKHYELAHKHPDVRLKDLLKEASASRAQLNALIDKGILQIKRENTTRAFVNSNKLINQIQLLPHQDQVYRQIYAQWTHKTTVLLHGVTGSGKTMIYIQLLQDALLRGEQALLLLPEIGLTNHIVMRLLTYFGDELGIYHSRFSDNERVEIWRKVADQSYKIIVGPRSALWLPFQNIKTIIIDEEHDTSYKQQDPAPRFNGRDAGIMLATLHQAKVLIGSATPSIESYHNALQGKYGLVSMTQRHQDTPLPRVEIVSSKSMVPALSNIITEPLLRKISEQLALRKKVIIFQNKRGYAPFIICTKCGWVPHCKYCDVSLTYHKHSDKWHCHYCGYKEPHKVLCQQCGNASLSTKSFGTEKVEEELKRVFKSARIARLDLDSVRSKHAHQQILYDFERGSTDVLIGTQMVVKGLDFRGVGLVGILSADSILNFPDYRVTEHAFQLLTQVAGRAGRDETQGTVLIQAYDVRHPLLSFVLSHDFVGYFHMEMNERAQYFYPPYSKIIKVVCKHIEEKKTQQAIQEVAVAIQDIKGIYLSGPSPALVSRVKNQFVYELWIRTAAKDPLYPQVKIKLQHTIERIKNTKGLTNVNIYCVVDA